MIRACPHCFQKNRVPAARLLDAAGKCGRCGQGLPAPTEPLEVSAADFKEIVGAAAVPVLVDFWAAWCGPCRMVAPIIEQLSGEYSGRMKVAKLDVDANQQVATKYNIRSIPSILFFKDGKHVDTVVGAVPKGMLDRKIQEHLS